MQKITSLDPESHSPDLVAENIAKLKELFPELLTECANGNAVNLDVLKQLVGDKTVNDDGEKYGLNWHGKRKARQLALTPSTGTLRPCPEDSVDWDTTQNLMIEGDNLEVLKLLQKSYAGKVKLIYIDPPYNTGKDFVYPDNFQDNIKNYLELTGQTEKGGKKLSSNTETSGRFHTDWLNMMYPRIKLARNLLREDGVILVSIDDGEVDNLRKICDEIFGEENFVTTIIWQKKYSPSNDAKWLSDNHDYLVLVAKSKEAWRPYLLPRTEEANARYSNPDNDHRGEWKPSGLDVRTYSAEYDYEITTPSGRIVRPPAGACWRVSKARFAEMVSDGRISFGKDGSNVPAIKRFLTEVKQGITPLTIWTYNEVGHNQEATKEVRALGITGFDSPKPVRLLTRALQICTAKDDIVLDFFAGSGTTAHAAMAYNATEGGNRRYILVQLPESLDPTVKEQKMATDFCDKIGKPHNIAELTKERLRRAGKKIRDENPIFAGDLGFRVFKLASSNIRAWESTREHLAETLEASIDHLKTDRKDQDILFELLIKLGIDLCVPIECKQVAGDSKLVHEIHSIGGGSLLVCLSSAITHADVESLALSLVTWHIILKPAGETTVIFRDSAFADDVTKTNLTMILQQRGIAQIRSL